MAEFTKGRVDKTHTDHTDSGMTIGGHSGKVIIYRTRRDSEETNLPTPYLNYEKTNFCYIVAQNTIFC